jgi:thioredoxin
MQKLTLTILLLALVTLYSCNENTESLKDDKSARSTEVIDKDINKKQENSPQDIKPVYLTTAEFKDKVWDYEANPQEWVYKGDLPCIIDFYADWCKPCKMVAPIMDDLADYYKGKVIVYKVDTDKERELASVFQVRSIPAILFSPMEGKPAMQPGALSKEDYINIIDEYVLKINKEES